MRTLMRWMNVTQSKESISIFSYTGHTGTNIMRRTLRYTVDENGVYELCRVVPCMCSIRSN